MARQSHLINMLKLVQELGPRALVNAAQYNLVHAWRDRRFGRRAPRGAWQALGPITSVTPHSQGVLLDTARGTLELHFLTPDILRVRLRPDRDVPPPFSYAVAHEEFPDPVVQQRTTPAAIEIQSERLICQVSKDSGALRIETTGGQLVSEDAGGIQVRGRGVRWTRALPTGEACYGLGQRASALNLRGKRLALWNADPLPYDRGADPVYASIPFYLGVRPKGALGILWDNPARGQADLGATHPERMTLSAEGGELCVYVIAGATVEAVLEHYTALTGRMPLPPLWALGFHQSRWGYDTADTFRHLAQRFRQLQMPCDALYFDIDYMRGYRCFTWDPQRFPDMPQLHDDLHNLGFKSVAIIDPGIKIDRGYEVYQSGVKENVFVTYPNGRRYSGPVWPGRCHFPDFTNPRVRAWWGQQVAPLVAAGFDGFWNDMNEPALITAPPGRTLPDYVRHDWEGQGRSHVGGGHNVYGMLMARATREGVQHMRPDRRPFVMTRASYAGAQRYTTSWTSDNKATWDHLRLSISMALNMGLSGLPFTGPDVGGFQGEPDGELFTRWMQLASMLPYFRAHTMANTAPQEPWSYGEPYETINRQVLERRYQLLPYLYSAVAQCAQDGAPIVRPLFLVDPADAALRAVDDAFMLGDVLLVAPVVEQGATRREVYLPRGAWYEFDTGKLIDGARRVTVDAPLERLPLYVRAGKVLPLWPVMQYVGERPIEEARLRIYAGSSDTALYEDAGEGLAYQQGAFRWSFFTCRFTPAGEFTIGWQRVGSYEPPYPRTRVEVAGISAEPEAVRLDEQGAPVWYYENGVVEFLVTTFDKACIVGRSHRSSEAQETLARPPKG